MSSNGPPSTGFGPPSQNTGFPPSMGPGAQPAGLDQTSMIRQIQEMRAQYEINIEPTSLKVAYSLEGKNRSYNIPFDAIPLSGFSKWLLYGGSGRGRVAGIYFLDLLRGAENMAQRPVTQREAEGFALHTGKRMGYAFMGTITSLAAGFGMAVATRKTMKFPFRKPRPIETYDIFPSKRLPLISGPIARVAWQTTRANMYAALALIFISPFFRSMGDSVMAVGLYRDERTKEVVKEMKGGLDRVRINRKQPGQSTSTQPQPQRDSSIEDQNSQNFYSRDNMTDSKEYPGENTVYGDDSTYSSGSFDTGVLSDSAMRSRETSQNSSATYSPPARTTGRSSKSDSFFFDDASPTAGNEPDPHLTSASSRSMVRGSTWERLRRGGAPTPNSMPEPSSPQNTVQPMSEARGWRSSNSGQGQDFETKGDSFSFSSNDEQKALAKEQAQREFDSMLERERRESGSGDYERDSFEAAKGEGDGSAGDSGGSKSAWDRRRK